MSMRFAVAVLAVAGAVGSAAGQERPLRLFFSGIGLSDPGNVQSPALNPASELNENLFTAGGILEPMRLYVWAQITPPGPPGPVTYLGVSFRVRVRNFAFGQATIVAHNFWNYTNNGQSRWQFTQVTPISPTEINVAMVFLTTGWGVTNATATPVPDMQRFRFAPDGVTRIDCTLLGYVDVSTASSPGAYEVALAVGTQGIARQGAPVQHVHFGWHDEYTSPLGNENGMGSLVSEAFIYQGGAPCDFQNPPPDNTDCDTQPDDVDPCPGVFELFDFDADGRYNVCDPCPYGAGGPCDGLRGDLDCSGVLDFFDIDPFVLALMSVSDYRMQYVACDEGLANMNADGVVNVFDVDPFLACLLGGACP